MFPLPLPSLPSTERSLGAGLMSYMAVAGMHSPFQAKKEARSRARGLCLSKTVNYKERNKKLNNHTNITLELPR